MNFVWIKILECVNALDRYIYIGEDAIAAGKRKMILEK